jgi:uncharacterized protein
MSGESQLMDPIDAVGVRVIGALIEKQYTTPDNYPLTLNALTAACNQTSNREPVMDLDEPAVKAALDDLAGRSLVREVYRSDSRAKRYRHLMAETLSLHDSEAAALCVLMLRGPQTPGEIRTRTARLFQFNDVAQVEITLQSLMTLSQPLVAELPRRPGQKEARYAHLLSGEPPVAADDNIVAAPARASRIDALEQTVAALQAEMMELRAELAEVRTQLDEFRRAFQ